MPGQIRGKVVQVSPAGNLVTNIAAQQLQDAPRDERVRVRCDEHETVGIYPANHGQPDATLLAVIGDSDCLELVIVGDSASLMLGIALGEPVSVEW